MASRQERIQRAGEIIRAHPEWGKNAVNRELRKEFGVGLRSSEVLNVRKSTGISYAIPSPRLVASRPSGLSSRRDHRYQYLLANGFLPHEARELSVLSQQTLHTATYRTLIEHRKATVKQGRREGLTNKQIRDRIIRDYHRQGGFKKTRQIVWKLGVRPDIWALVRNFYDKVKDKNKEYVPPWLQKMKDLNQISEVNFQKSLQRVRRAR